MNTQNTETGKLAAFPATSRPASVAQAAVWPSARYARQVANLRRAIGQPVYIVELTFNDLAIGAVYQGRPHVLLDVSAFARPDPAHGLYPHMLVLDDGRGINLGRRAELPQNTGYTA